MRTEIFDCPALDLNVFREDDGSLTWRGLYKGVPIKDVMPVGGECIILLDPDAGKQPVFKNLLRIGRGGYPRWLADLPASPDAFIDMRSERAGVSARTWSGYTIRIDPNSGRHLGQEFVK